MELTLTTRDTAKETLRISEIRYRRLFEAARDGILILNAETLKIADANPYMTELLGYRHSELIGKELWEIGLFGDRVESKAVFNELQRTGYIRYDDLPLLSESGKRREVEFVSNVYDEDGTDVIQCNIRDISARKRAIEALSESEERNRELVENAIDIIYTHDLKGNYTSVNRAAERITGYTREESLAMNMADTVAPEYLAKARHMLAEKLAGNEITAYEIEVIAKDGHRVSLEVNTRIIYESGTAVGVQGIARDITDRKRAVAELQEKSALLEAQLNSSIDGILIVDEHGKQIIQNQRFVDLFKIPRRIADYSDDAKQVKWVTALMKDPDKFVERVSYLYSNPHEIGRDEIELKNGTVLDRYSAPVLGEDNKYYGRIWTFRDITERKQAEKEIELTMQRLNAAQRLGRIGDWEWNVHTEAITWSPEVFEIVGRDPLLGPPRNYEEMGLSYEPASMLLMDEKVAAAIESGEPQEYEVVVVRPDGERVYVQAICEPKKDKDGQTFALAGTIQDISARKSAEAALADSEFRYHSLFENMIEGYAYCQTIFKKDVLQDFVYTEVNAAFEKLTGLKDVGGKKVSDVVPGLAKASPELFETLGRVALTGHPEKFETYVEPLKIWLSVTAYSSNRENFVAVFDNITEQKRVDEAIRDSEERFSGAFELAPIGVALVAPDGQWLMVNRALCDLVGYTEAELLSSTFQEITHADDLEDDLDHMRRLLAGEITSYQIEKRYIHKLGHDVSILLNVSLVRDAKGQPGYFISQIQDITERKELEDQFRQSQKMEAVGVMAGGIAHDFNNLLTAINGYSDLTLKKMSADEPLRRNIEEVKKAGDRAAELTSQLLAFSRKQVLKPIVHSLNTVIETIEKMLRRIIRENIELRTVLAPDLGNIKADPGQIEQVIMNLAVNARDAMPAGGTLTIATQNVFLDAGYVSHKLNIEPGPFVRVTVTDTGVGIDGATQEHIFEPFFTTKEVGKGTGLGLAMVYGIVKQSGGDIMVYSEPGHGTTFKIYLPRVDEQIEKPKWIGDGKAKYLGTETILLVEDEEVVRRLVREILTGNGYTVLEAENGRAAIAICSSYEGHIDMLLTDMIMPKMSCIELKQVVIQMIPGIKVMFMSGYTDDSIAKSGVLDADTAFIEKPFTPDALSRKVREVLES